jgi:DNA-binding NarL/FixJ family response regulator
MLLCAMAAPDLSAEPMRVLAVDDQVPFREAARRVVDATAGFAWAGEADSGADAVRRVRECTPDLVIMDVRMPGMDGIETARRLAELVPDAFVVLISLESSADLQAVVPPGVHAHVRKQDLSVRTLPALWAARVAPDSALGGRNAAAHQRPYAARRAQ